VLELLGLCRPSVFAGFGEDRAPRFLERSCEGGAACAVRPDRGGRRVRGGGAGGTEKRLAGGVRFGEAQIQYQEKHMITLTTPSQINSILGGNAPVSYDKLVVSPMNFNPVDQTIVGQIRLTSTADPAMDAVTGSLRVDVSKSELLIDVPQVDFRRRIVLSAGQKTSVLSMIESAQASVENGLVALAVISGTRSAGA
jgi:hypothetical protein